MSDVPPPPPYLPPPPGSGAAPAGQPDVHVPGAPPVSPYGPPPSFEVGAPAAAPRRSGKAIAGLVLGVISIVSFFAIVTPILALVFGLLGAREVKRSAGGRTGLGMARAGWILGALTLLGAVGFWVFVGSEIAGTTDVRDLEVGDCVDLPDEDDDTISRLDDRECTEPHDAEVVSAGDLGDGDDPYPGLDEVMGEIFERCSADFEDYVGRPLLGSDLAIFPIYPGEDVWDDDQSYVCLAFVDGEQLTASVAGSER